MNLTVRLAGAPVVQRRVVMPPPLQPVMAPLDRPLAACDPGVRVEYTLFDTNGRVHEIGARGMRRFMPVLRRIARLQQRHDQSLQHGPRTKAERNRRRRNRRRRERLWWRVKNRIRDNHIRVAEFVVKNFSGIIMPTFETQRMAVAGRRRGMPPITRTQMYLWAHYALRTRIEQRCRRAGDVVFVLGTEEFTTKTCQACGGIHEHIGGNEVFRCPQVLPNGRHCPNLAWRDWQAARSIMALNVSRAFNGITLDRL